MKSTPGPPGGHALVANPQSITLLMIIEAEKIPPAMAGSYSGVRLVQSRGDQDRRPGCSGAHLDRTHTGPLVTPDGELPASGEHQSTPAVIMFNCDCDELKEWRHYFDVLAFLHQIGAAQALKLTGNIH